MKFQVNISAGTMSVLTDFRDLSYFLGKNSGTMHGLSISGVGPLASALLESYFFRHMGGQLDVA
jgi:hypothetical protein